MKLIAALIASSITLYGVSMEEKRLEDYHIFIHKTVPLSSEMKLEKVNNYFNMIVNELDINNWGIEDYWATPQEFIEHGKGDCEDFAIAKYFALKELGFNPSKMMIMIVKVDRMQDFHAVLGVKDSSGEIMILDNLSWKILPLTKRTDLKIVRWVNESIAAQISPTSHRDEVEKFRTVIGKISR